MASFSFTRLKLLTLSCLLSAGLFGQASDSKTATETKKDQAAPAASQEPPEEDEQSLPEKIEFNPLEAQRSVQIGNFYLKRGNLKAALQRYERATKFNPGYAEAYARLGFAYTKLHDEKSAHEAYKKYLELEPDGKEAASIRKKLSEK